MLIHERLKAVRLLRAIAVKIQPGGENLRLEPKKLNSQARKQYHGACHQVTVFLNGFQVNPAQPELEGEYNCHHCAYRDN